MGGVINSWQLHQSLVPFDNPVTILKVVILNEKVSLKSL